MAHTGGENKETVVYLFDAGAVDNEDREKIGGRGEKIRGDGEGKLSKKVKGFLCNKCVICVLVSLVGILITGVTLKVVISSSLQGLSCENRTMADISLEAFDQSNYVPPEDIQMKAKTYFRLDKHNRTVWFVDMGHWAMESLLETNTTTDEFNKFLDYNVQKIRESMREIKESDVLGWALVINMDGYGLAQAFDFQAIGFFQEVAMRHFGFLNSADYNISINNSYWSRTLLAIFRPFMGDLLDRYEVFGYDDWLPTLSERISEDQLPPGYTSYAED